MFCFLYHFPSCFTFVHQYFAVLVVIDDARFMLCTPEGIYLRNFYVGISIMGKEMGQGRGEHFVDCLKINGGMGNLCSSEFFFFFL